MACPICGERCTCTPREDASGSRVSVILDPDFYHSLEAHATEDLSPRVNVLVDPELPGAGEDHFAASLAATAAPQAEENPLDLEDDNGQFLGSSASPAGLTGGTSGSTRHDSDVLDEPLADLVAPPSNAGANGSLGTNGSPAASSASASHARAPSPNGSGWREEVANRLDSYRSRRRRRVEKSLSLNFEQQESATCVSPSKLIRFPGPQIVGTSVLDPVMVAEPEVAGVAVAEPAASQADAASAQAQVTGTLSVEELAAIASLAPAEELAEPVVDWTSSATYEPEPAEAETETTPSLAMTLESYEDSPENAGEYTPEPARFAEFAGTEREFVVELPLQAAPLTQRLLSTAVDGGLVAVGAALFSVSFFLFTEAAPTLRLLLPMLVAVPCFFWCAYQYMFLAYVGSTPGMFVAGLELITFDDGLVDLRTRRWRAVATVVSCVSLGLGYLWSLVDEDSLTWHDRITRTLVAPERLL